MLSALVLAFALPSGADNLKDVGLEKVTAKVKDGYNFWLYTPSEASEKPSAPHITDAEIDILFERFLDDEFRNNDNSTVDDAAGQPKPLVIFLHGKSLCGSDLDKVRKYGTISAIEKGRALDAYVIAPQNPGGQWQPEKIMEVVDYVCGKYNIDENRIYVLGMSLGGYGTLDFAATYPDRIAAAIGMGGGATKKDLSGLADMPVWIIHGTGDDLVPVSASDKVASAIGEARDAEDIVRLQYDRIPGMNHSILARVFYRADVYEWLFTHSLSQPDRPLTPTLEINDEFFNSAYQGLDHSKGYKSKKK